MLHHGSCVEDAPFACYRAHVSNVPANKTNNTANFLLIEQISFPARSSLHPSIQYYYIWLPNNEILASYLRCLSHSIIGICRQARASFNSFSRWQREEDSREYETNGRAFLRVLEDDELEPDLPLESPAALRFLDSLQLVDLCNITNDRHECVVCTEAFYSLAELAELAEQATQKEGWEVALRFNCWGKYGE